MNYLVDKKFRQINLEAWFDEDERRWLERGAVCWNPCVCCEEGKEEQQGYIVEDILEEEMDQFLMDEEADLYYIDGKVLPRDNVQISFHTYISHPDYPVQRELWLPLTNMQIATYQEFFVSELSKYKKVNPADTVDKSLWKDWLEDAFAAADFKIDREQRLPHGSSYRRER